MNIDLSFQGWLLVIGTTISGFILGCGLYYSFGHRPRLDTMLDRRVKTPINVSSPAVKATGAEAKAFYAPVLNRLMGYLRASQGDLLSGYLKPRLAMADIDKTPEQWVAEQIIVSIGTFIIIFSGITVVNVVVGMGLTYGICLLAGIFPILAWVSLISNMSSRRARIKAELPGLLILMAAMARVAPGFDSPGGILPETVRMIDGDASNMLYDLMLESGSQGVPVEDLMERMGNDWDLVVLDRISSSVRLARSAGTGLAEQFAGLSARMTGEQEQEISTKANTSAVTGVIPIVIFDIPAGLLLVLFPAFYRLKDAFN